MAFITVEDVEPASGGVLEDADWDLVEDLIPVVVGAMEAYLGRAITVREHVRERVNAHRGETSLYVRNYPVESVAAVWADGFVVPAENFYAWPYGVRFRNGAWYPSSWTLSTPLYSTVVYEVTYTGGLSDPFILAALKEVAIATVLRFAAEAREGDEGRLGYLTMRVEDYSWSKPEAAVSGLAGRSGNAVNAGPFGPGERVILDRYRRRVAVSG